MASPFKIIIWERSRKDCFVSTNELKNYTYSALSKYSGSRCQLSSEKQKALSLFWWTKWKIRLNSWFLSQSFHKQSVFVWDFFLVGCLSLWLSLFFLALISVDQILVLSNSRGIPRQEQHSLIWCLQALVFAFSSFVFASLCVSFISFFHFSSFLEYSISEKQEEVGSSTVSLLDWFFKELQNSNKCLALVLPRGSQSKDKCLSSWWKIASKPVCEQWLQA